MSDATAGDNVVSFDTKRDRIGGDAKRVAKIAFHAELHLGMDLRPDGSGAVYRSVTGHTRNVEVPDPATGALVLTALYHEILNSNAFEAFCDDDLLWDWDTAHAQYIGMMREFSPWLALQASAGIETFEQQHDLDAALERHKRRERLVRRGLAKPLF